MPFFRFEGKDLVLSLKVQPRASRNEFADAHGDSLKVRLRAAPVDGRANEALVEFLAEAFAVPKRQVHLLQGQSGRQKLVKIVAPATLPAFLAPQKN
jgi:hypothetical protein